METEKYITQKLDDIKSVFGDIIAERNRLREFIIHLFKMNEYPDYIELDGFEFEEICIKHGILIPQERTEGCGEGCTCEQMDVIEEKGFTCNRFPDWLSEGIADSLFGFCKCKNPKPYEETPLVCSICNKRIFGRL